MRDGTLIVLVSFAYLGLLFAIAYMRRPAGGRGQEPHRQPAGLRAVARRLLHHVDLLRQRRAAPRRPASASCPSTSGPTLTAALWWFVLRKMIRISRVNRITSIADFMASRYGKSQLLGGLVTVIAVVGVVPYIALQLKAVSTASTSCCAAPASHPRRGRSAASLDDHALYVALLLAAFTILFGTRHLDATERHEGMVAAIAFESIVKLVAFLAVGAVRHLRPLRRLRRPLPPRRGAARTCESC